jgi:hypothetical protein
VERIVTTGMSHRPAANSARRLLQRFDEEISTRQYIMLARPTSERGRS